MNFEEGIDVCQIDLSESSDSDEIRKNKSSSFKIKIPTTKKNATVKDSNNIVPQQQQPQQPQHALNNSLNMSPRNKLPSISHNYTKDYIVDDLDKPWNYRIMLQLKTISNRCKGYKFMHEIEMTYLTQQLKILNLLEIIFVTLHGASIGSAFVAIFVEKGEFVVLTILTCVQTLFYVISTVLKTYKEGMEYTTKINSHRNSFIKFSQITTVIENQLCLPVSKRASDETFLEYKSNDFNDTLSSAPVIRPATVHKYLEELKNKDNTNSISFGTLNPLEIVIDKDDEEVTHQVVPKPDKKQSTYEMDRFLKVVNVL